MKFTRKIVFLVLVVFMMVLAACSNSASGSSGSEKPAETPLCYAVKNVMAASVNLEEKSKVVLAWTTPENYNGVRITWSPLAGAGSKTVAKTEASVVIDDLDCETEYTFLLISLDANGNITDKITSIRITTSSRDISQSDSGGDTTPPGNVVNLVAKAGNEMAVLTWADATEDDIFGYEVTWGASYQNRSVIGAIETDSIFVAPNTQKCIVGNLQNGIEYTFTVKAMDTSGNKSVGVTATAIPQVSLAATTPFNVEYYQQNIDDDDYTLVADDTETGVTNTVSKQYAGFHLVKTVNETTASDGSVVEKFYYDRNIVTVTFELDGGTTETILNKGGTLTGKFGALMGISNPTKQGFIFKGWKPDLQGKFPAQDTVCTAVWYNDAVQSVELDNTVVLVVGGKTAKLNAVVTYADGTTSNTATWTSSDESLATVDDYGNITTSMIDAYTGCQTVTITAQTSFQTATCTLCILNDTLKLDYFRNTICPALGTTYDKIKEFVIPEGITTINGAFSECKYLAKVTIPDSVTSIENSAFRVCTSLESVNIPSSVTSIGGAAFYGCTSLESVTIPSSVTSIGRSAFDGCTSLANVTIPSSVTSIEEQAFRDCTSLASITVPSSVTSIGDDAFFGCTSLASVTIPSSVEHIGYYLFGGCKSLKNIEMQNGVERISGSMFRGCTSLESVTIPSSVTSIEAYAFYGCTLLASVTIPSSVTSIGNYAFRGCTSLASVTIPSSVASIGYEAFVGCTSLKSIEIPSGVTSIGGSAFSGCTSLASVIIPSSVTSIGDLAFNGCKALTSIAIPNSVESIKGATFQNCASLASVTIPSSVTSIGNYAFSGCTSLASITIPEAVTSIGIYAFSACPLTDVTFKSSRGWYVTKTEDATTGTNLDLSDSKNILNYLTNTYVDYYWYKN